MNLTADSADMATTTQVVGNRDAVNCTVSVSGGQVATGGLTVSSLSAAETTQTPGLLPSGAGAQSKGFISKQAEQGGRRSTFSNVCQETLLEVTGPRGENSCAPEMRQTPEALTDAGSLSHYELQVHERLSPSSTAERSVESVMSASRQSLFVEAAGRPRLRRFFPSRFAV